MLSSHGIQIIFSLHLFYKNCNFVLLVFVHNVRFLRYARIYD